MALAAGAGSPSERGADSELGRRRVRRFTARQPVRWLAPPEIARGAYGEFFGGLFSRFVDSRDRQAQVRRAEVYHHPGVRLRQVDDADHDLTHRSIHQLPPSVPDDGFVVDYVADVGDGFGSTYAIADLIATSELGGGPGSMLIMGGDQVYPVADDIAYGDRTVGPYQLAFRDKTDAGGAVVDTPVFAIPGNHDWYDGLVSFLNRFARSDDEPDRSGGGPEAHEADPYYETINLPSVQTRSYFAIALPHHWWIWGVDTGLGVTGRVDLKQIEYFRSVAELLEDEDRVILCPAEPSWLRHSRADRPTGEHAPHAKAERIHPDSWDNLLTFLQTVFPGPGTTGVSPAWTDRVRLVISGDKHFYARHEHAGAPAELPRLVTSGGGGAYLSSTRGVPDELATNVEALSDQTHPFVQHMIWPSKKRSTSIGLIRGLFSLPAMNPYMAALIGVLYGLLAYSAFAGLVRPAFDPSADQTLRAGLIEIRDETAVWSILLLGVRGVAGSFATFLLAVLVVGMLLAFAWSAWTSTSSRILATVGHVTLHTVALGSTMWLSVLVVVGEWPLLRDLPGAVGDEWLLWVQAIVVLLVVAVTMTVPIVVRWRRYGVREAGPLWVLLPTVLALAPVPLLLRWDEQFATGTTLAAIGALIGGACGLVAFAVYLVICQYFNTHLNELFVGLRMEDYKQFLRLVITADGVTARAIGYERVNPRTVTWDDHSSPELSTPGRAQADPVVIDEFFVPRSTPG